MKTSDTIKLAPCPFCGAPGKHQFAKNAGLHWVECSGCETDGPAIYDYEKAVAAWNRRAADAAPQAPCAKLVITDDHQISETSHQYAPGLPPGEHDVYCVPMSVAPPLADAARGMTEEDRDACNVGAALANDRAGTFKGHHDARHWLAVAKRLRALAAQEPSQREGE